VKCQHGDLYTKQEQEEKRRWASWPQQRWKVLVLDTLSQLPLIHWVHTLSQLPWCHFSTAQETQHPESTAAGHNTWGSVLTLPLLFGS